MSVSMFTRSPTALRPRVVTLSVSGISETSNQVSPTALTVSETPSTAIDPLLTTSGASFSASEKRSTIHAVPGVIAMISLVPSMCP